MGGREGGFEEWNRTGVVNERYQGFSVWLTSVGHAKGGIQKLLLIPRSVTAHLAPNVCGHLAFGAPPTAYGPSTGAPCNLSASFLTSSAPVFSYLTGPYALHQFRLPSVEGGDSRLPRDGILGACMPIQGLGWVAGDRG